jgi:hypothetical protein
LSNELSASPEAVNFLKGASEMAGLIRAFDWAATPLGPIEAWPQSLKTATGLIVQSSVPIVMLWGREGVMIYNDAAAATPNSWAATSSTAGQRSPTSTTMS